MKGRLSYMVVFPWEFRRLGAGVQSMLGFMVAFGVGPSAAHQLGWISDGPWHLLMVLPCVVATVTVEKMMKRHRRLEAELQIARELLYQKDTS